eukprot:3204510-Rhodomonas_salina.1
MSSTDTAYTLKSSPRNRIPGCMVLPAMPGTDIAYGTAHRRSYDASHHRRYTHISDSNLQRDGHGPGHPVQSAAHTWRRYHLHRLPGVRYALRVLLRNQNARGYKEGGTVLLVAPVNIPGTNPYRLTPLVLNARYSVTSSYCYYGPGTKT